MDNIRDLVKEVENSLNIFVDKYGNDSIELEGRLGIYDSDDNKFDSNIGEENYAKLKALLDSCENWKSNKTINLIDSISNDNKRLSIISENDKITKKCIIKKRLATFTYVDNSETLGLDFRISISLEISTNPEKFNEENIILKREKNRNKYFIENFSFDLTEVIENNEKYYEYEIEDAGNILNGQSIFSIIFKLLDGIYACQDFIKTKNNNIPIKDLSIKCVKKYIKDQDNK